MGGAPMRALHNAGAKRGPFNEENMPGSKSLRTKGLFSCVATLGLACSSTWAGEPLDLPSIFKEISIQALKGGRAPAARDVWAQLGFDGAEARITWRDTGLIWSSNLDRSPVDALQSYDSINIQSSKIHEQKNKEYLPVEMISIELSSGEACIDPKSYMDKNIEYHVVPVSMHDASIFDYISDSGGRYSAIESAGFAYKEPGCAKRLLVRF
jgi:hypothetical protein